MTINELKESATEAMLSHGRYGFAADRYHGVCVHAHARGDKVRFEFGDYNTNLGLTAKEAKRKYIGIDNQGRAHTSHQRESWWAVDKSMWKRMEEVGIMQGFEECTLVGDVFSIAL